MMISLTKYFTLSILAASAVIYHAFATRRHFFPATMYLSTSKLAVATVGNLLFATALAVYNLIIKMFLGSLREIELERVKERLSSAIMETCLALTIFREEFNLGFVAMFTALTFVKVFHWLVQDRVDYIEVTPAVSRLSHARIVAFMALLWAIDCAFLQSTVTAAIASSGQSVQLLFAFEYVILVSGVATTFLKYCLSMLDARLEGRWEGKGAYVFYLELMTDMLHLFVYVVFFVIVFTHYGLPLHLIRDLYLTFRNFRNRIADFLRFRQVTARMDRFPDATAEDLARCDGVCIICREEMQPNGMNKRLACGHVFHLHCLRSWLERQQNCPTCRASVFRQATAPPPPQGGGAAAAAAAGNGALQPAARRARGGQGPHAHAPAAAVHGGAGQGAAIDRREAAAIAAALEHAGREMAREVAAGRVPQGLRRMAPPPGLPGMPPGGVQAAAAVQVPHPAGVPMPPMVVLHQQQQQHQQQRVTDGGGAGASAAPPPPAPGGGGANAAAAQAAAHAAAMAAMGAAAVPLHALPGQGYWPPISMWQVPQWFPVTSMAAFPNSPLQYAGQQTAEAYEQQTLAGVVPVLPFFPAISAPFSALPMLATSGAGATPEQQQAAAAAAAMAAAAAAMCTPTLVMMPPAMMQPSVAARGVHGGSAAGGANASAPGGGHAAVPGAASVSNEHMAAAAAAAANAAAAAAALVAGGGAFGHTAAMQGAMEATQQMLQRQLEYVQQQMDHMRGANATPLAAGQAADAAPVPAATAAVAQAPDTAAAPAATEAVAVDGGVGGDADAAAAAVAAAPASSEEEPSAAGGVDGAAQATSPSDGGGGAEDEGLQDDEQSELRRRRLAYLQGASGRG